VTARPVSSSSARDGVDTRLAQIEQRAEAATKGPWYREYDYVKLAGGDEEMTLADKIAEHIAKCDPRPGISRDRQRIADAWFIAQARADVPWLVAQLRDARAENERLIRVRDAAMAQLDSALATKDRRAEARADRAEAALAAVRAQAEEWRNVSPVGFYPEATADARAIENCGDALLDLLNDTALAAAEQDEPKRCAHGLDYPHAVDREDGYHFPEIRCPGPVSQPTEGSEQCDGCSEPNRCGCKPGAEFRLATCPACDGSGFASTYDGRDLGICSKCDGHGVSR
jgi:hypothetical protein